ncbi:hypothetical protein ACSNOI_24345 [Actinomadura kijaniata]|uniref:hypothetical protein n=1 Tax=Actinomadura kijaniata TaxID=46161 RepID=UPI003F1DD9F6
MFWPGAHRDMVATVLSDGNGGYQAVAAPRGAANQTWRFEEVDLSGEAVPVQEGMYATGEGREVSKWYEEY